MDFSLSDEQEILRKSAREFLSHQSPLTAVREAHESELGYSPTVWRAMAGLGWMGLMIPEEYGGTGGSFVDLVVLLEEMGQALLPSPFVSTILSGLVISEAGSEEQKRKLLPRIARGELIPSLALTEPSATFSADGIHAVATGCSAGFVINGTKLFVRDANVASLIVCVMRTGKGATPEDGITLLLVDRTAPGITMTPLITTGRDREAEVVFEDVKVARTDVIGNVGEGWPLVEKIIQWGALAECAEMVGCAQRVMEMSVNYAKQRVQFGRPIGSFQAIQHRCANMMIDVDGSRFLTYLAAWKISEGMPAAADVSRAKSWVSEAFMRTMRNGHQIHGGLGYTLEHDLHLYFLKHKSGEVAYGDPAFHRKAVARELLH